MSIDKNGNKIQETAAPFNAHPGTPLNNGTKTTGDFWEGLIEPYKELGKIPMGDWFKKHAGLVFGEALILAAAAAILMPKKKR